MIGLIIAVVFGFWGANVAKNKNRNTIAWFVGCFCLPLIGIICAYCSKPIEIDMQGNPSGSDTFGTVLAVVGVVLTIISVILAFAS